MKYLNLKKQITLFVIVAFAFTACDKPKTSEPMGDAGQTLVKIIGGGTPASLVKSPVDFVPTPTQILAVDLRRDIPSAAELNRVMIVTVKDDTAAVRAKDPSYIQLPTAWYTIQSSAVKTGGQGGTYTFTFQPGEFAKQIYITIPNATLFNPSSLYGLGFTITTADANGIISSQKSVVIEIGAKNAYDGIYAVTGPMVELTGAPWTQWNDPTYGDPFPQANGGAWEGHLITSGANTCYLLDNTIWGCCGHPMLNAGGNSGFGSFGIVVDFNPATGAVTNVHNYYGDPAYGGATALGNPQAGTGAPLYMSNANTRRATLDPSGINAVQGNKDVLLKYFMNQSSVIPAPPNIRITFDEKWQYIGPR
jgi:hypothetical protein